MPRDTDVRPVKRGGRLEDAVKRGIDILGASAGLIISAPLFPVLAVLIKSSSPGPVLYIAERTGRYGLPFRIMKFRTMQVGSDAGSGTTAKNDPRVTAIGAFLRKYKIDEIPQFINILVGDMSLVGPRPELPKYTAMYSDRERTVLSVRPGLTDFASIEFIAMSDLIEGGDPEQAFQANVMEKKNRLRIKYVEERSLALDFKLMFMTARKILVGHR
jgi:lipopolysaccharide/colanic/teichoic acid biosynthesis glycosyltransferase